MAIKGRTQSLWDGTVVGLNCGGYANLHEIKGHGTGGCSHAAKDSCSAESWNGGPLALVL